MHHAITELQLSDRNIKKPKATSTKKNAKCLLNLDDTL